MRKSLSVVFLTITISFLNAQVLINEFDTNTASSEYIELFNTTAADIDLGDGYSLVFYNGNGDSDYQTTTLTGYLPANGFFVIAESGVTDIGGYTPDQNATWGSFQNGTDAVALVNNGTQVDAIIYGSSADTGLEALLGLSAGTLISNGGSGSSSRVTDGQGGSSYANDDWHITATRTPGATNVAAPPSYTTYTIVEIQTPGTDGDASQHEGELVETSGIITAMTSYSFYMQDGTADYSGVYVYVSGDVSSYSVGDQVTVQGTVFEYNGLTQITGIADVTTTSTGNDLPAPTMLTTGSLSEAHEGMLVKISGECTAVSTNAGSDHWAFKVDDSSGDAFVDDQIFSAAEDAATLGTAYDVVGPVNYYYTNFTVNPRDAADVVEATTPGETCADAISYGAVNDASMAGDLVAGTADWYSFTTDGSFGEINLSLCGSTGLADSRIAVFANCADFTGSLGSYPDGSIGYNDDGCQTAYYLSTLDLTELEAGTYYAVVYGYSSYDAGAYELAITGVADPCDVYTDTHEPNDVQGDATVAVNGDVLTASICPAGESDWFVISGLAFGTITAETAALPDAYADTYMSLYDAGGNLLDADDDGGFGTASLITYELPADGDYYFEVRAYSSSADFGYTLSVTVDDPPLPVPQNLVASAGDLLVDLTWEPVPDVPLSFRYTDSVLPIKTSNPKDNLSPAKQLQQDIFVRASRRTTP